MVNYELSIVNYKLIKDIIWGNKNKLLDFYNYFLYNYMLKKNMFVLIKRRVSFVF